MSLTGTPPSGNRRSTEAARCSPPIPSSSKSAANATNASDNNAERARPATLDPPTSCRGTGAQSTPWVGTFESLVTAARHVDAPGDRVVGWTVAGRVVRPLEVKLANHLAEWCGGVAGDGRLDVGVEREPPLASLLAGWRRPHGVSFADQPPCLHRCADSGADRPLGQPRRGRQFAQVDAVPNGPEHVRPHRQRRQADRPAPRCSYSCVTVTSACASSAFMGNLMACRHSMLRPRAPPSLAKCQQNTRRSGTPNTAACQSTIAP